MLKRRYFFAFAVSLLALSGGVQAQTLSIDDCVGMALSENKTIRSAVYRADQYKYTSKALKANFFPNVSLQLADFYSTLGGAVGVDIANPVGQYIVKRITELAPLAASNGLGSWYLSTIPDRLEELNPNLSYSVNNVVSAMLQIEQPVYMGGKIRAGYKMGQLGAKMADLGIRVSEEEVILKTYEAYSLVLKAQEMRAVAVKYDSLLVDVERTVSSAVRNGMAAQADLMKVNAAKSKAQLQVHQAENGLKIAKMNLCQVVGLPLNTGIDVLPIEDQLELADVFSSPDVSDRNEYHVLDMKTEIARENVKVEQANFLPQIGLMLAGGYINGGQLANQTMFNNKMHATVALNVKIPIFHAGEGRNKVQAAQAEYEQARLEQSNLTELMQLETQKALNELDEAVLAEELNTRLVAQAEERLRVSRGAYNCGMETLADMLTAQTEWQNAYAEMVDAHYQRITKQIGWLKSAGKLGQRSTDSNKVTYVIHGESCN
ncbi:MAG: TolC family protein [Bacteroidales bacterium]|nr:TolC family protein [Bacteroidales bacterium]